MRRGGTILLVAASILGIFLAFFPVQNVTGWQMPLWAFQPQSSFLATVQTINDVTGDGHEDIFVATQAQTRISSAGVVNIPSELIFLNGKTGKLYRSLNLGDTGIDSSVFVNGHVILSRGNGLEIYNSLLQRTYSRTFNGTPRLITVLNQSHVFFAVERNITLFNLEKTEYLWTLTASGKITDILVMSKGVVFTYPNYLVMRGFDGSPITGTYVPRPEYDPAPLYTESLHKLDDNRFLYFEDVWVVFGQSPYPSIIMWETSETTFSRKWTIEVGGGAANKPFAIPDVDGDKVNDFICSNKDDRNISVFSGQTGQLIYSPGPSVYYIDAATRINDIDKDGIDEVALASYSSTALCIYSFKQTSAKAYYVQWDLYDSLVAIEDVDGDGLLDFVAASAGGRLDAYRGFVSELSPDKTPPTVSILSPQNTTYAKKDISLIFTSSEPAHSISLQLDKNGNTTISGNRTLVDLVDGRHTLVIYIEDASGNVGKSNILSFTIDSTPPQIQIYSPENTTYSTSDIPLDFVTNEEPSWIAYSLGNRSNITINGNTTLVDIPDGKQSITLYARDLAGNDEASNTIHFTVDTTPPNIELYSPRNETYATNSVPLNYSVNEPTSWIGYSIDGTENITLTGNKTLDGLSEGPHRLLFYAKDPAGNINTSDTYFTISIDETKLGPSTEPQPTSLEWVLIIALIIIAGTSTLAIYRRSRHRNR